MADDHRHHADLRAISEPIIDDVGDSAGVSHEAGLQTYQPETDLCLDDRAASAQREMRTLVSHLNDVECEEDMAQDTIEQVRGQEETSDW